MPTIDASGIDFEAEEETAYGFQWSVCNILNNPGSLLTRKQYELKGNNYLNHHIQKFLSTIVVKYIPLLYIEAMLCPSIYWETANDHGSIVEAIPSSLMNEAIEQDGFATIQQNIRTRLTTNYLSTSTDPRYISYSFDVMSNLSASYNYTRMMMYRGLTVKNDIEGGLGVLGKGNSSFLGSVDSK